MDQLGVRSENPEKEIVKIAFRSVRPPLEHVYCLTGRIPNRQVHLSRYGLALTRVTARRKAINPVWYVDITQGHDWLMNPINTLIDRTIEARKRFSTSQLALIAPFIEQMGTGQTYRKEFWWEREWRTVIHDRPRFRSVLP